MLGYVFIGQSSGQVQFDVRNKQVIMPFLQKVVAAILVALVPILVLFIFVNFVLSILGWSFHSLRLAARGEPGVHNDLARLCRLWWQVSYLRQYRC